MSTKKKISIFLLTTGVIMFLCEAYCCYQKVEFKKAGQQTSAKLPAPTLKDDASFKAVEVLACTTLFTAGALMIGAGSYQLGLMKARNAHSFTLDFSVKERLSSNDHFPMKS